jgi:hypothetical protein
MNAHSSTPPLSDWNWAVLMLNQALIGAISPNFRLVELFYEDNTWRARVTLREESEEDREEISGIWSMFDSYLSDVSDRMQAFTNTLVEGVVSTEQIVINHQAGHRVVFLAREAG